MPRTEQIVDTLWHCLCPSFSRAAPARQQFLLPLRPRPSHLRRPAPQCLRSHSSATTREVGPVPTLDEIVDWDPAAKFPNIARYDSREFNVASQQRIRRRLRQRGQDKVEALYVLLEKAADVADPLAVENYARFLIEHRGEQPNARIYAALLQACAHQEYGSVSEIERLLQEMEHNNVALNTRIYEVALKALACHPSYTLREALLHEMEERWISLSTNGWHYVCCAQIREKQIELALHTLEQMEKVHSIEPRPWLLEIFCHVLAEIGEFDALMDLVGKRLRNGDQPEHILWLQILAKAAEKMHHPVVANAWQAVVKSGRLNPSTGLCTLILNTAARAGDETLAADVLRVLGNRSSSIQPHHYEALIEATLNAKEVDLTKALTYLCIMEKSIPGSVKSHIVQPVTKLLEPDIGLLDNVLANLREMKQEHSVVPVAVLDAVLEVAVRQFRMDWAVDLYTDLHQYSATGEKNPAQLSTFNTLLQGCREANKKSLAMFLAAEMVSAKIKPDTTTYDSLILACLGGNEGDKKDDFVTQERNSGDAFRYFQEMRAHGHIPSETTLVALAKALARLKDRHFFGVLDYMERHDTGLEEVREYLDDLERNPSKVLKQTIGPLTTVPSGLAELSPVQSEVIPS